MSLRPVARLLGEEPADPPGWFHGVSSVARDEVKMGVGHSLAGYIAAIDSQVHSFEAQTVDEPSMKIGSQGQHLGLFVRSQAEEIRLVALGTISVWPGLMGYASGKAAASGVSNPTLPSSIRRQNGHWSDSTIRGYDGMRVPRLKCGPQWCRGPR